MDVSVPYVVPVKKDLIRSNDWGLLWGGKSKQVTSSNLAAEIGSALVLLSISSPPLEGHMPFIVGKDKEGEEFAEKEKYIGAKLTSNSEFRGIEEIHNSKSTLSFEADANEKKKVLDMAVDEKPHTSSKLISAMKGSREKTVTRVEKLSVSWADDVYDPPVTSQSHTITNDIHRDSTASKKSYRNKNKNKAKSRKSNTEKKKGSKTSRNSSKVASY